MTTRRPLLHAAFRVRALAGRAGSVRRQACNGALLRRAAGAAVFGRRDTQGRPLLAHAAGWVKRPDDIALVPSDGAGNGACLRVHPPAAVPLR